MRRASASPIPHPPGLVVTPGSNSWDRTAGATPGPSSRTATLATAPSPCTRTSTRPPRPLNASTAFFTNASRAHSTSTGSPATVGPGLARHRHPQAVARGGDARAHGPYDQCDEAQQHAALQRGEPAQAARDRDGAEVDGADARLNDRYVDDIEPGDEAAHGRGIAREARRDIVEGGDTAG